MTEGILAADRDELPRTVRAAGAVLWRPGLAGRPEVALVHRPHHGDWSLPKGKVDPGEARTRTAVREIAEETGFEAALGRHLATVRYPIGADRKVVDYWSARAVGGAFAANSEVDELRWLTSPEAAGLLTYDLDRTVLSEFAEGPFPVTTLLLVRHAKAGKRAGWAGADDDRPLEERGREQAVRVADLLGAHGVRRLHAAPKARCRETLGPAAHRLGVGVVDEPAFTDAAVERDPDAARDRLLALAAAEGGTAAICAQGSGIPRLVSALAGVDAPGVAPRPEVRSNRRLSAPPARKGSVWVLSFHSATGNGRHPMRLVAADYVRDPAV